MKSLTIKCESPAQVSHYHAGRGILHESAAFLQAARLEPPFFVVASARVGRLYGARLRASLDRASLPFYYTEVPDGERYKTLSLVGRLYDLMTAEKLDRHSCLVAFGGGVVCDLAGFAAATYMRGIPHAFIPTTLLAQVDASIGGKVAVDHRRGKNLIGTFHQPRLIICDADLLSTLARRQYAAGMAEVIKTAAVGSAEFFTQLEHGLAAHVDEIIYRTAEIKARVVMADPYERNVRAHLNFGHTLGHAIETAAGYRKYLHGEAVALGMVGAALLSEKLGLLDPEVTMRLRTLLAGCGLPVMMEAPDRNAVMSALMLDKKRRGSLRFVLLKAPGTPLLSHEVTLSMIDQVLDCLEKNNS